MWSNYSDYTYLISQFMYDDILCICPVLGEPLVLNVIIIMSLIMVRFKCDGFIWWIRGWLLQLQDGPFCCWMPAPQDLVFQRSKEKSVKIHSKSVLMA